MQLSVIIVNYNVRYFLEHCLTSVVAASSNCSVEIIVVDNNSSDDSVSLITKKFPQVILIANLENVGFARANNLGVKKATGEYILYLNPDTIVPEDCFEQCLQYLAANPEVGALGCRLIDGKGQFLPESKRGFPSAAVAFYKISGLSGLFPKSKRFNQYHIGYLPEHSLNDVDVLAGCFMFCQRKVIDEVGGFDEDYFMYGEDIDLSYKIKKAGYRNIYFPKVTVIHYKGESTSKGSMNYVKMFYKAMIIFARKHLSSGKRGAYVALIQFAVYVRSILAIIQRLFSTIKLPLIDSLLLVASLMFVKFLWIRNIKTETTYSNSLLMGFFVSYVAIWLLSIYLNGGYDKPYKSTRLMRGMLVGGIFSLLIYGLLPESIRFSRGITVLGALTGTVSLLGIRKLMQWLRVKSVEPDLQSTYNVLLVADPEEEAEIKSLLNRAFIEKNIVGSLNPISPKYEFQLGVFDNIVPLTKLYAITEVIFAQRQLQFKQIIEATQQCGPMLDYKIHSHGTDSIIGSNSKNTAGDLYTTEFIYAISTPQSKRNKRVIDILFSMLLLAGSPILFWFVRNKKSYFTNSFLILEGERTFVGYQDDQFPELKPSLFTVFPDLDGFQIPSENQEHLNWLYAKNYEPWKDVKIILSKWRSM